MISYGTRLHHRELRAPDQVLRAGDERYVQRHDVGAPEQIFEADEGKAQLERSISKGGSSGCASAKPLADSNDARVRQLYTGSDDTER